jgi:hypothetical protein
MADATRSVNGISPDNQHPGAGHNGGPPLRDRGFKKRWALALFARQDKPAGAVAMGFKIYMEMDGEGRGATISDAEFQVCCGVSDGSCRTFKRWLLSNGFIAISVRGRRGYRSEFRALIPDDGIPAAVAGIEVLEIASQPAVVAGIKAEKSAIQPATVAAIPPPEPQDAGAYARASARENTTRANKESPTGIVISEASKQDSSESADGEGLAGLNGAADVMLSDILGWMNCGDKRSARQWLSTTLHTFGQVVTAQSYHKLKTDLAEGLIVSRPLQTWTKIAQRMKAGPASRADKGAAPTEDGRGRMRRYLEEAAAKQQQKGTHQ